MTDRFPHVTIPRDMLEETPPLLIDRMVDKVRRAADAWYALPQAERDRILDALEARREAERDEWLRTWVADQRMIGLDDVTRQLDRLCLDLGLDPYVAWRRPRANERAAKLAAMTSSIRRDLAAAGHRPTTTALEATTVRLVPFDDGTVGVDRRPR